MLLKKKRSLILLFLVAVFSMLVMGCDNKTPVEDIHFNLNSQTQIIMFVGQELEIGDKIEISPSYATNKNYDLYCSNLEIVNIVNSKLVALKEGSVLVKVSSQDDTSKQDMMTVVVKDKQTELTSPKNLKYLNESKTITFDKINNASSYSLKLQYIDGEKQKIEQIELGNSSSYNFALRKDLFDKNVTLSVRANPSSFSYAYLPSQYSEEYTIHQVSEVENLKVQAGILTFEHVNEDAVFDIYINGEILFTDSNVKQVNLNNVDEKYSGTDIQLGVVAKLLDSSKQQEINYFDSSLHSKIVHVYSIVTPVLQNSVLSWQNIIGANVYDVYINDEKVASTTKNSLNISSIQDFETKYSVDIEHLIKVLPVLEENKLDTVSTGIAKTIRFKILNKVELSLFENGVNWNAISNATNYKIIISQNGEEKINSLINSTSFSFDELMQGDYSVEVQAVSNNMVAGVYILSSQIEQINLTKLNDVQISVENGVLIIPSVANSVYKIEFDIDETNKFSQEIKADSDIISLNLMNKSLKAGEHVICVHMVGNKSTSINGNTATHSIVQLENYQTARILEGKLVVDLGKLNTDNNAQILAESVDSENNTYDLNNLTFNTTQPGEDYLKAGDYTVKIKVIGDGINTLSYNGGELAGTIDFSVLQTPTIKLPSTNTEKITYSVANATKYKLFNEDKVEITETENDFYDEFTLTNGENLKFIAQAVGNGSNYLDSGYSNLTTIERLKNPVLTFDNLTNSLTKSTTQGSYSAGFKFSFNDQEIGDYEFGTNFENPSRKMLVGNNQFKLVLTAKVFSGDIHYLDSNETVLTVRKIDNQTRILINDYKLHIMPEDKQEIYDINLKFDFGENSSVFSSKDGYLVLFNETTSEYIESVKLPYSYINQEYVVDLLDGENNFLISNMTIETDFDLSVKFIKQPASASILANSDYSTAQTLKVEKISNKANITVNSLNKLVITPQNHNKEYGLKLKFSTETTDFVSNNGVLTNGERELSYIYKDGAYYVDLLEDNYSNILTSLNGIDNFNVSVQFLANINSQSSNIDSNFSSQQTIEFAKTSSISRLNEINQEQYVKFNNVANTYTKDNYALVVNDSQVVELDCADIIDLSLLESEFKFDVVKLTTYLKDYYNIDNSNIISLSIVTKNNADTTATMLSRKGAKFNYIQQSACEISYSKDNTSAINSGKIEFNSRSFDYLVTYSVLANNVVIQNYNAENKNVEVLLDNYNLEQGLNSLKLQVLTTGSYFDESLSDTIQVFNSQYSNEILVEKISSPANLQVSGSVVSFGQIENAIGYEVYSYDGINYTKLNSDLVLVNYYNINDITGEKHILVKAISSENGYTNSALSESIKVNKLSIEKVDTSSGDFVITLSKNIGAILEDANINLKLTSASSVKQREFNLKQVGEFKLEPVTNNAEEIISYQLTIEAHEILAYVTENISTETITLNLIVEYVNFENVSTYYLNSNNVIHTAYGLFAPENVQKVVGTEESGQNVVELISYSPNDKNVIGSKINTNYVFKITYSNGESEPITIYSYDTGLLYFDATQNKLLPYPKSISNTSFVFPYGYDQDGDGVVEEIYSINEETGEKIKENGDVLFGAGSYIVAIKSIPANASTDYNICSSQYTQNLEFVIMSTPELTISNGYISWEENVLATSYSVAIYKENNEIPTFVDNIKDFSYDFSNISLIHESGIYSVSVQAISSVANILNSKISDKIYVYRLPQVESATIDDGNLILNAVPYFNMAKISFVDNVTGEILTLSNNYNHSLRAEQALGDLNATNWQDLIGLTLLPSERCVVKLDSEVLALLDGRGYTLNIQLLGNSNNLLGVINSSTTNNVSDLTAIKLNPIIKSVDKGVLQFSADQNYINNELNINYNFNNVESPMSYNSKILLYKLVINGEIIYTMDYTCFTNLVANNEIVENVDYSLQQDYENLYAVFKIPYLENEITKYVLFNVYNNNVLDFKNSKKLYYYSTTMAETNGEMKYSSAGIKYINVALGGAFDVSIYLLGGDLITEENKGYLTSNNIYIPTFRRYKENVISTKGGLISFVNLPKRDFEEIIDCPIYRLEITVLNTTTKTVVYLYNNMTEQEIIEFVQDDVSQYSNCEIKYIYIEETEQDYYLFDMSEAGFSEGAYNINIKTLAGTAKGDAEAQNYVLDAISASADKPVQKLSSSEFSINNGVLTFALSYINSDNGQKIYNTSYEITILDSAEKETVLNINSTTSGFSYSLSTGVANLVLTENFSMVADEIYKIKIKALSTSNLVINGSYKKVGEQDYTFSYKQANQPQDVQIVDGKLRFVAEDSYEGFILKITYPDANGKTKSITTSPTGTRMEDNLGNYIYTEYEFLDTTYDEDGTGTKVFIDSGTDYTIYLSVKGNNSNIINSEFSSGLPALRLPRVEDIRAENGILTWNSVEGAVKYALTITQTSGENSTTKSVEVETNYYDFSQDLTSGNYSVSIKAIGQDKISAIKTIRTDLVKLEPVQDIHIEQGKLIWTAPVNAERYLVNFQYNDSLSDQQIVKINSYTPPENYVGEFTISVIALAGETNKTTIRSNPTEITSSTVRPMAVVGLNYQGENNRVIWSVNEWLDGDSIQIDYDLRRYDSNGILDKSNVEHVTAKITKKQEGNYYSQDEIDYYYYTLTVMGTYTNFQVKMNREGAISSPISEITEINLQIFDYGDGDEVPYPVKNTTQLFNIYRYNTAKFKLVSSIDFLDVDLNERISQNNGAIITSEFSGTLDGENKAGENFGFVNLGISSNSEDRIININSNIFALFGSLQSANLKNLTFSEDLVINMFAKTDSNVIKLSLIALGVSNSTLENIKISSLSLNLYSSDGASLENPEISIAGVACNLVDSDVNNLYVTEQISIMSQFTQTMNVGGLVAIINNDSSTQINSSNVTLTLSNANTKTISYVGGVVARFVGDGSINNTNADLTISGVNITQLGGIVGYANGVVIYKCLTTGKITHANSSQDINIGGIVGYARNVEINSCTTELDMSSFIIKVNSLNGQYLGAIVGSIIAETNRTSIITDCLISYDFIEQTTLGPYSVGVYGNKSGNVTINCSKKES